MLAGDLVYLKVNWTKILDQVGTFQIKSITDSLFRNGVYILIVGTISAIFKTHAWVTILLFSIAGILVLVGLVVFIYFVKKNPDYLRTEDFQLRKQSIEMLGDKDNQLNPQVKNIIYITSPFSKQLDDGAEKSDFGNNV